MHLVCSGLSHGLDKLSPRSIKCVFVGYFRTQKGWWYYNPSIRKYLVFVDVIFFESVLYFSTHVPVTISEIVSPSLFVSFPTPASTVTSLMPQAETTDPPASKTVQGFRYVYTHRSKVLASKPIPINPSPVEDPPPPSISPSDLDIPVVLRKGK